MSDPQKALLWYDSLGTVQAERAVKDRLVHDRARAVHRTIVLFNNDANRVIIVSGECGSLVCCP
jgi:hypothetical protein